MTTDQILFGVVPYLCLALAVAGAAARVRGGQLTITTGSSALMENRRLFWAAVPWHYGILVVLTGHLLGWLFPRLVLSATADRTVLLVLETVALACGMMALLGLLVFLGRRLLAARVRATGGVREVLVLVLLLAQVVLGLLIATRLRWGIPWYAGGMSRYLWSIVRLSPAVELAADFPWLLKGHLLLGFVLVALLPFTRLIHLVYAPLGYLWRKPQLVVE